MGVKEDILALTGQVRFQSKKCHVLAELSARIAESYIDSETFEGSAMPLMDYMRKNHHPHVTAIVDSDCAELLEGLKAFNRT